MQKLMLILYKRSAIIRASKYKTDKRTAQTGSWTLTHGQGDGTFGADCAGSTPSTAFRLLFSRDFELPLGHVPI